MDKIVTVKGAKLKLVQPDILMGCRSLETLLESQPDLQVVALSRDGDHLVVALRHPTFNADAPIPHVRAEGE